VCPYCRFDLGKVRTPLDATDATIYDPDESEHPSPDSQYTTPDKDKIGKYRILSELGRGAMGLVYKAIDPDLDREVALKTMIAGEDASEEAIARFKAEAKSAGKLQHPNIVGVHEVGQEGSLHYLVMDYIEGCSIKELIERASRVEGSGFSGQAGSEDGVSVSSSGVIAGSAKQSETAASSRGACAPGTSRSDKDDVIARNAETKQSQAAGLPSTPRRDREDVIASEVEDPGPLGVGVKQSEAGNKSVGADLAPARSAEIIRDVAQALYYAHTQGIIHRDLKPANIMVDAQGTPHLMDFGLARNLESDSSLTKTGAVMGTPAYLNPEQAGAENSKVDARSDVYSLGAVFYEMLTGVPPVKGDSLMNIIFQVLQTDPLLPRKIKKDIPKDLEIICLKCMFKEPGNRYQTAADLANDLDRFLNDEPITARPPSLTYKWGKRIKKNKWAFTSAALIVVLLASFGAYYWIQWYKQFGGWELVYEKDFTDPDVDLSDLLFHLTDLETESEGIKPFMAKPDAQPGDICIMFVPADFQKAEGRNWQQELQKQYGGTVIEMLHLMIQRFTPGNEKDIEEIETFLENLAEDLGSFPVLIHEIFSTCSGFRKRIILKGETPVIPEITAVAEKVNKQIEDMSCKGHYSFIPRFVTLLEGLLTSIISEPGSWEIRKIFRRR
jgi:serine/threonine protein kinase